MGRAIRNGAAGITLIETLVVLVVIGVAGGAMTIGFSDRSRSAEAEAVRLARHITLGMDEALIAGLPMSLQWDSAGYSFGQAPSGQEEISPADWPAAVLPALGQRHDLARPLELRRRDITTESFVVLPVSGAAPTITFEIVGADPKWTVTFDGFRAFSLPEARF